MSIQNGIIIIGQFVAFWIVRAYHVVSLRLHVTHVGSWSKGRTIIISNHQSRLDGFIITTALPVRIFLRLAPFSYMAKNEYLDTWWKRLLLFPLGLYLAFPTPGRSTGLKEAQARVKRGHTSFIFPEGRRSVRGESRAHKGAAVLARKNRLVVQPVSITWSRPDRRRTARIIFGAPYCLCDCESYDRQAAWMLEQIYLLGDRFATSQT